MLEQHLVSILAVLLTEFCDEQHKRQAQAFRKHGQLLQLSISMARTSFLSLFMPSVNQESNMSDSILKESPARGDFRIRESKEYRL